MNHRGYPNRNLDCYLSTLRISQAKKSKKNSQNKIISILFQRSETIPLMEFRFSSLFCKIDFKTIQLSKRKNIPVGGTQSITDLISNNSNTAMDFKVNISKSFFQLL